jgi:branched-subunit amino acid transport protein
MMLSKPTIVLVGVAVGVYLIKSAVPMLLGGRQLPKLLEKISDVAPAALLMAMVVSSTVNNKQHLVVDARLAGVVCAGIAQWRKLGFVSTVAIAVVVTAFVRFLNHR